MKVKTLFIVLLVVEGVGTIKNLAPGFSSDGIAHLTHLLGLLGGFLYMKYIYKGYYSDNYQFQGTSESSFTNFTEKVKQTFANKGKTKEHDTHSPHGSNEMLDKILKKVSDYGVSSLTEKEKQFLEKVSEARRKQRGEDNIRNLDDYR